MKKPGVNFLPHFVYRHYDRHGMVIYIGVARLLFARTGQHQAYSEWWDDIVRVTATQYPHREAAMAAEREAIKNERPLYNGTGVPLTQRLKRFPPRGERELPGATDIWLASVHEIIHTYDPDRHPEDWEN